MYLVLPDHTDVIIKRQQPAPEFDRGRLGEREQCRSTSDSSSNDDDGLPLGTPALQVGAVARLDGKCERASVTSVSPTPILASGTRPPSHGMPSSALGMPTEPMGPKKAVIAPGHVCQ